MIEFTGRISDDLTPPEKLNFKVYQKLADSEVPLEITSTGEFELVNTSSGEWIYTRPFSEGNHTLLFTLDDEDTNRSEVQLTFSVEPSGNIDSINPEPGGMEQEAEESGQTGEPEQSSSTEIEPESTAEAVTEIAPVPRPYIVSLNIMPNGVSNPEDYLQAEDMTGVPVDSSIEIIVKESGTLNLTGEPLIITSDTRATLKSTEVADDVIPGKTDGEYRITFTPTETLEYSTTYYVFVNPAITNDQNGRIYQRFLKFTTAPQVPSHEIHGNFGNNTNSCANCHSTHNGNDPKLLGGKYGGETAKNLCMSCHDGTNGAPIPDHYNAANQHFNYTDGLEATYSCTSCHNPHTGWTEENPNKLKNHPENTYKKQGTATGISTDFSLCFQCHNGNGTAVDIEKYYKDETLLADSGHKITAEDGTSLNGQLTCADCHETHGSDNLKLLKGNLGNAPLAAGDQFKTVGTEWTVDNERNFCLKCHNGNTELYGKNPIYNAEADNHQDTTKSCSSCHGSGEDIREQMRSAAHAPKKLIVRNPEPTTDPVTVKESGSTLEDSTIQNSDVTTETETSLSSTSETP